MIFTVTANPAVDIVYGLGGAFDGCGLNRAAASAIFAGGKGINVSRAILREGGEAKTFCLIGGGVGDLLCKKLSHEGIDVTGIRTACETRVNVCAVDSHGNACEINAPGGPVTAAELDALTDAIVKNVAQNDIVILAGSLPVVDVGDGREEKSSDYWSTLIPRLKGKGATVILDCSGEALRRAVYSKTPPDIIKPNLDELCELLGMDRKDVLGLSESRSGSKEILFKAAEKASKTIAERGISVLATLGSHGALFTSARDPEGHISVESTPVTKVSNIKGAGDTFLGVFTYGHFVLREDIRSALAKASVAAADHVAGNR